MMYCAVSFFSTFRRIQTQIHSGTETNVTVDKQVIKSWNEILTVYTYGIMHHEYFSFSSTYFTTVYSWFVIICAVQLQKQNYFSSVNFYKFHSLKSQNISKLRSYSEFLHDCNNLVQWNCTRHSKHCNVQLFVWQYSIS